MKKFAQNLLSKCVLGLVAFATTSANAEQETQKNSWLDYYSIERVDYPETVDPQIGGLTVMQDGRIGLALNSGEIVIYDPKKGSWKTFAKGLHLPLGIVEERPGTFVVMQKPELTRISDTDGDGKADQYRTLYDDFGMTGNYHEFAFGPARDSEGNYYISLNVASNFAGVFENIRGNYSDKCNPKKEMEKYHDKQAWIKGYRKQVTRMFSCAPYRGWVIKVSPDGKAEPFAAGFRSPAGVHVDKSDQLWVTDNQGDWIATSPLVAVNKGDFAHHPAALNWLDGWDIAHKDIKTSDIEKMRKRPAALFPQGELANSPTQPLTTTGHASFGLPEGELIIGEMNMSQLIRYLPDQVKGHKQGTLIPFIGGEELGIGNFRLDFAKDDSLWIGKIHLGWAGDEGLVKIQRTDKPMFIVEQVKLVESGFKITFNQPVKSLPQDTNITRHTYRYHKHYGSPKINLQAVDFTVKAVANEPNSILLSTKDLIKDHLYTIDLGALTDEKGRPLMGHVLRYQLSQLP
ncbi:DUF7133 domain-containing protein [Gayadomonas joobiniege]|uniref:DUF7133 domain-containing protein n=1 Tax=Gayadomonas joobiniege TaxID=1234606 RepID=UPI00036191E5|nr:hypothetical protein [Gayadomonas joobiniege]